MVSGVSSSPYYSYLNQLEGNTPAALTTPTTSSVPTSSTATTPSSASSTATSLVSSLLSGGSFSPEALTLLQQNSSGSFDPITSLLGGTSTNNGNTTLEAYLLDSVAASALTQAQNTNTTAQTSSSTSSGSTTSTTPTSTANNFVLNLINGQTQASVAYNQTIQQNAQNVLNANSYGPDGVTPLVA